jgi:NAD(P)-dependent dehydrogenase (short-subunit alcohol dehydrogenase family)
VNGLTKSTAFFYQNDGIRANAVVPGGVTANINGAILPCDGGWSAIWGLARRTSCPWTPATAPPANRRRPDPRIGQDLPQDDAFTAAITSALSALLDQPNLIQPGRVLFLPRR